MDTKPLGTSLDVAFSVEPDDISSLHCLRPSATLRYLPEPETFDVSNSDDTDLCLCAGRVT